MSLHVNAASNRLFAAIADPAKPFLTANRFATMTVPGDQTSGPGTVYRWRFEFPLGLASEFDEVVTEWIEDRRLA